MKRVFLMILDSFGIGFSDDADQFDDVGSNTLGHIAEACFLGQANVQRQGNLYLPNLTKLGLLEAFKQSTGQLPLGMNNAQKIIASYGCASEISSGKDTTSGHWEIAGVPVLNNWSYFLKKNNSFPENILKKIKIKLQLPGFLGNCHASGTDILIKYGEKHIKTGKPIVYTSSDSVFQVACHEIHFGLSNLYNLCDFIRNSLNKYNYNVARVIARPFIGDGAYNFQRTSNRRDLSVKPMKKTVMEKLIDEKKGQVIGIGKISDIYAGVGISKSVKADGLIELCNITESEMQAAGNNTMVCTNFVDFDSLWGHRRDVSGYAAGLEFFDSRLPKILKNVQEKDLLIITADHGCDPTWKGTDHTREHIPILLYSPNIYIRSVGHRKTFSDIAQTIAKYFRLSNMEYGTNML